MPGPDHRPSGTPEAAAHLQHHFDNPRQQFEAVVQGMWLFLVTEVLLFGGLFAIYAVYRANHPEVFVYAHHYLSVGWGALNTAILLCSSFTMATGVWAAQHSRQRLLVAMLSLTLVGGGAFLGVKYVEYRHKWREGLLWGGYYHPHEESAVGEHAASQPAAGSQAATAPATMSAATAPAASTAAGEPGVSPNWAFEPADSGPRGLLRPGKRAEVLEPDREVRNVQLFFSIYFGMTGLHGLHVIVGLGVIAWLLVRSVLGHFSASYFSPVEVGGLYWHLVDVIWIYLFPLLYLIH